MKAQMKLYMLCKLARQIACNEKRVLFYIKHIKDEKKRGVEIICTKSWTQITKEQRIETKQNKTNKKEKITDGVDI